MDYVEADEVRYIQQLRLFIQILRIGDSKMIEAVLYNHHLMGQHAWLAEVHVAWKWVIQSRGDEGIGDIDFGSFDTLDGWSQFQPKWRQLKLWLKQAIKGHCIHMKSFAALRDADMAQKSLLQQHGWVQHVSAMETPPEEHENQGHLCDQCGFRAATEAGLAVHQHRIHGARIAMRRF